ncbi:MAG: dihydropteroate synthase [Actinomycetota bacterium]
MSSDSLVWRAGTHEIRCDERTLVMGILNVTPDSFSDGGQFLDADRAVEHGLRMVEEGADIVDVGGESTRPGSDAVSADDERDRVVPVIERLVERVSVPISIDTMKPEVAADAVKAGASIVNDVSGARDPAMFDVVRDTGAGLVLMHMLGEPKTMQAEPHYDDVVREIHSYLRERQRAAADAGIPRDRLCVDPGIGFGKTAEHNLTLIKHSFAFRDLGVPVLFGPSRKAFLGRLLDAEPDDRLEGTIATSVWLASRGVHILRVHDVRETARAVRVVDAIRNAP